MSDNIFVATNTLLYARDASEPEKQAAAAAEAANCTTILSEDLAHGAQYFGITLENPFLAPS